MNPVDVELLHRLDLVERNLDTATTAVDSAREFAVMVRSMIENGQVVMNVTPAQARGQGRMPANRLLPAVEEDLEELPLKTQRAKVSPTQLTRDFIAENPGAEVTKDIIGRFAKSRGERLKNLHGAYAAFGYLVSLGVLEKTKVAGVYRAKGGVKAPVKATATAPTTRTYGKNIGHISVARYIAENQGLKFNISDLMAWHKKHGYNAVRSHTHPVLFTFVQRGYLQRIEKGVYQVIKQIAAA